MINLGRLLIRDGDGGTAYCLFEDLYCAVRDKTKVTIDGKSIDLGDLIRNGQDTRSLITWLWSMLLADGTRALVADGRFDDAVTHLKKHKGIGQRLLDGRQVLILAHCTAEKPDSALALVEESVTPTSWEQAVAACLSVHCRHLAEQPDDVATAAMTNSYLSLASSDESPIFHARLGLCVIDSLLMRIGPLRPTQ